MPMTKGLVKGINQFKMALWMLSLKAYNELPIQQIILFLTVAEGEGVTMTELHKLTRMNQSSLSKNIKALGTYLMPRKDNPEKKELAGLGLVKTEIDIANPRTRMVKLTPKGEELIQSVLHPEPELVKQFLDEGMQTLPVKK